MSLLFFGLVSGVSAQGFPLLHEVSCENGMRRDHCWLGREYAAQLRLRIGQRVKIEGHYRRYKTGGWQITDIKRVEVVA